MLTFKLSMRNVLLPVAALAMVLSANHAMAVSTSHWVAGSESDFKGGTLHNVVVTNLGDIKLSRAVQTIHQQDPNVTTVNALAEAPDGTIYAGTGPKGILLAVKDNNVTTVATLDDTINILSINIDDKGALLIGTGGDKGQILRIAKPGDKPTEIFSADGVQYIWAMQRTLDGNIYAATGPNGQVFEIKPDGSHSEIYKGSEDNITSLITNGKDLLYLGTDPNGLVVRLNRTTHDSFILYNAGETEITALAMDKEGNLYAATGEAGERQPQPGPGESPKARAGRPEADTGGSPIPSNPTPTPPKPPELPNPNPGQPKPIPKNKAQSMNTTKSELGAAPLMLDVLAEADSKTPSTTADDPGGSPSPSPAPGGPPGRGPITNLAGGPAPRHPSNPAMHEGPPEQKPQGNAIYKIDKDGFVTEIFRQNVVIYSMITQNDLLLVATGDEGNIYQVNPKAEETLVLAKVDAKQIMCLLAAKDGRVVMGLANTGGIAAMTGGYASDGNYISPVLDATQVSRFGKIQLHGQLPDATTLKVATRSGNVKDSDAPGWSKWSDDVNAEEFVKVAAPSARFLQYRLSFTTTDTAKTSIVDHVDVTYQIPNLAPVIKSIKIGSAGGSDESDNGPGAANLPDNAPGPSGHADTQSKPPSPVQTITWDASDPNSDPLTYSLYFRLEPAGEWILLKDKLKEPTYDWDTRNLADGRYQVKVQASDAAHNPPGEGKISSRVSSYFVVDNTAPTIGDVTVKSAGADINVDLRATVQTSIISSVEYAIDSSQDWQLVLPVDNIYDSPDEKVSFTIKGLSQGSHQLTIRATDSHGNQALQTEFVKVGNATAQAR